MTGDTLHAPQLEGIHERLHPRGLAVVGVARGVLPWSIVVDRGGKVRYTQRGAAASGALLEKPLDE